MSLVPLVAGLALAIALVLSPALPEVSNTILLATMILSLVALAHDLVKTTWRPSPSQILPSIGLAIFAVALLCSSRSPANFFPLLALLPLALALPLSRLLVRLGDRLTPLFVSSLALAGSSVATAISATSLFAFGIERAELTMNAIHMGDLALTLGFVAAAGVFASGAWWRLLFLAGPVLAFMTIWWSGSRGPLLTFGGLTVLSFVFAVLTLVPARKRLLYALLVAAFSASVVILAVSQFTSDIPGLNQIALILGGAREAVDYSTSIRLEMLLGAWQAFLASPIYGHGGEAFMQVAAGYSSRADLVIGAPHLHSDIADFAAIAGSLGLVSYVLLLVTPLLAARDATGGRRAWMFLAVMMSAGYLGMGLTNAMFGILTLTLTYALLLAILFTTRQTGPDRDTRELDANNLTD